MAGKTVILACETKQVGISKGTLSSIEKGETTVSIGAYVVILEALGMAEDFEFIAIDDEGKKNYSDMVLKQRKRATKRNNKKRL